MLTSIAVRPPPTNSKIGSLNVKYTGQKIRLFTLSQWIIGVMFIPVGRCLPFPSAFSAVGQRKTFSAKENEGKH